MTKRVTPRETLCSTKMQTCGSELCHNFDPTGYGFSPPESFERTLLTEIGERGVVGVVGAVDSLGASSDATDSGGGDGLWRNPLVISLGSPPSASR